MRTPIIHFKGAACILALYGAPAKIKEFNTFLYNFFIKATAKNTSVLLSSLPPTTDAAFEHLKRVYLQTQIWLGNNVNIGGNILQKLFCNCKKGCGAACGCRKSSLNCSVVCLQCNGTSCFNTAPIIRITEVEENN